MLDRIKKLILYCTSVEKFYFLCLVYGTRFTADEMQLIMRATSTIESEFKGQQRHTGEPVLTHMLSVAAILMCCLGINDANLVVAALLHDLVEDRPNRWTVERVALEFNRDVANLVASVTKRKRRPGENKHQYEAEVFAQVKAGGLRAITIKVADRIHNILTPWGSKQKQREKIRETVRYVSPLAEEIGVLWEEITIACAEALVNLKRIKL